MRIGRRRLTFELSGALRQDALAAQRMMNHSAARPAWPAVACPLERGVRRHFGADFVSFSAMRVCQPGPVARQR